MMLIENLLGERRGHHNRLGLCCSLTLATAECLKIYTDRVTSTKANRLQWNACLAVLCPGDTLIIWKIDHNLRDMIDIITLNACGVGAGR